MSSGLGCWPSRKQDSILDRALLNPGQVALCLTSALSSVSWFSMCLKADKTIQKCPILGSISQVLTQVVWYGSQNLHVNKVCKTVLEVFGPQSKESWLWPCDIHLGPFRVHLYIKSPFRWLITCWKGTLNYTQVNFPHPLWFLFINVYTANSGVKHKVLLSCLAPTHS